MRMESPRRETVGSLSEQLSDALSCSPPRSISYSDLTALKPEDVPQLIAKRQSSDLVIRAPRAISFFNESGSENECHGHNTGHRAADDNPSDFLRRSDRLSSDLVIRALRGVTFASSGSEEFSSRRLRRDGSKTPTCRSGKGQQSRQAQRENYGATIIPIRTGADGGMEVLCAQSTMVNYLRTKRASEKVLMYCPCDVRFLGGFFEKDHVTPLDTVLANLTSPGVRSKKRYNRSYVAERALLERATLLLRLFSMTPAGPGQGAAKVFHFLCTMDAAIGDSFAAILNQLLRAQRRFCEEMGDALFSMREAVRAPLCPKFHEVRWQSAADLLQRLDEQFFNAYMQEEFLRYCVDDAERQQYFEQNSHRDVLRKLCNLSVSQALGYAETVERSLRAPTMAAEQLAASPYRELQDIAPGLEKVWLLSYNLNILPYGASLWGSGQGQHAEARLRCFLERIAVHGEKGGGPDIISLQELFATPFVPGRCLQRLAIKKMASLGYRVVTGGRPSLWDLTYRRKWTDSGLVIFCRFPVIKQKFVPFTAGVGLDAGATKGALWARLQLSSGKCVDVINCHLQASHTGASSRVFESVRTQQLDQLRELVREMANDHPLVLTGDFNVDAIPEPSDPTGSYGLALKKQRLDSKDYQHLLRVLDPDGLLVDLLCGPTKDSPLGRARGAHPCTRPPRLKLPRSMQYTAKHKYPQRLDYVFYRPALPSLIEHQETRIVEFKVYDPKQADFEHLSDHFGICACFQLRCRFAWRDTDAHGGALEPEVRAGAEAEARALLSPAGLLWGASALTSCALVLHTASGDSPWRPARHLPQLWLLLAFAALCCAAAARLRRCAREERRDSAEDSRGAQTPPNIVASSPYDAFTAATDRFPDRPCLGQRRPQADASLGKYSWLTYREVQREVLRISSGLVRKFDLQRNAKVGLLGNASVEWLLCDLALMRCGADTVCLTEPPVEVHLCIDRSDGGPLGLGTDASDPGALLVASVDEAGPVEAWNLANPEKQICKGDRIVEVNGKRGSAELLAAECKRQGPLELRVFRSPCELLLCSVQWLEHYVQLAKGGPDVQVPSFPIVVFNQVPFNEGVPAKLVAEAQYYGLQVFGLRFIAHFGEVAGWVPYIGIGGSQVFTTMYRSRYGASSQLAEVVVTLQALALASNSVADALPLGSEDVHFSYTSPAFFGERVVMHAVLSVGGAVGFFGGVRSPRIFEDIRELGPTFLLGTPSLFSVQLQRLQALHVGAVSRLCFAVLCWALRCGEQQEREDLAGALARLCLARPVNGWLRAPFRQARAALLGRTQLRFVLALCSPGAAAMPPEVCLWLRVVFGCRVLKGLVLAEVGGLATLGEAPSFGEALEAFAVGRALPGVCVDFPSERFKDVGFSGREWPQAGAMVIRGPFAVSRQRTDTAHIRRSQSADEHDAVVRIGVVGLERDQEVHVLGRLGSLEISLGGHRVLCDALEQLLVQHSMPWLVQLFLTAREHGGVVGIGVVRLEELWRLARHHRILVKCSAEALCRSPEVRARCLQELQRRALRLGFAEAERPRALHLEFEPFSQERELQTPMLQLRRDKLKARFAAEIDALYAEVAGTSADAGRTE